jgi:hypothetical protein
MALTLAEAGAQTNASPVEAAVIKMFMQTSPILGMLPFKTLGGPSYTYRKEVTLPGIGWRAVNSSWTESTGVINPTTEHTFILGGEIKIDNYLMAYENGSQLWAAQTAMKVQAASNEFDRSFLEGDDLVDPNGMVGLRRRLTGNQVILAGTNGATLTLAMLDQLIDRVIGTRAQKMLLMNKTLRRKVTSLVNAAGNSALISYTQSNYGIQNDTYAGVKIGVVETIGDESTYLDFDETTGSSNVTASVYCVFMDETMGVHGLVMGQGGKTLSVKRFGEQEAEPRHLGRLEFFPGMAIKHGRSAARLRGILNA